MNFPRSFATRITFFSNQDFARLGVLLALVSVALGVAVMEISLSVVSGFEQAVAHKVVGFIADVQIGAYLPEEDNEMRPLALAQPSLKAIKAILPRGAQLAPYIQKDAILQSEETLEGVVLKGVAPQWNSSFFKQALKKGTLPNFDTPSITYKILISRKLADLLKLDVGDRARLFFLEKKVRARPITIAGIYETGMAELDQTMVICDMRLLQRILGWNGTQVEGFDIHLPRYTPTPEQNQLAANINTLLPPDEKARAVEVLYPDLFDWLRLQHQNVAFILILMTAVAVINMTSAILILITERTGTIGILKALGASNRQVRRIFLWNAFFLVTIGTLAGNLLGIGLLAFQQATGWVVLDPDSYFVKEVPVAWEWLSFLGINLGVILVCTLAMLLPAQAVTRITPVKAIRF